MNTSNKVDVLALKAFTQSIKSTKANTALSHLLTHNEKIQIGRRILIAQAILAGKTRFEINNHLSVSPNTFAQIRKWLESEFTEYNSAYSFKPKKPRNTKTYAKPFTYEHLKQKYPAHFLLFSLVEELFKIKK